MVTAARITRRERLGSHTRNRRPCIEAGRSVRENVAHMKDFRGMKRQRSRNRKPSGNSNNPNRAYESNGPEGTKVRGNAQTIYEKYQQLARDANSSGDRVLAENHLQHAEHYFRLIRQMQPQRPVSEFVQRDPFSNGFDFDEDDMDGDEVEAAEVVSTNDEQPQVEEARYESRDRRDNRNDRNNGDRNNAERNNRDRSATERNNGTRSFEPRGDRNNGERYNNDRNNGERVNGDRVSGDRVNGDRVNGESQRSFEPRGDRNNAERNANVIAADGLDADGRRETRRERYERRRAQRLTDQEQNPNGANGYSAAPLANDVVVAPSFIAPTEPLKAPRAPKPAPAPAVDADHLPAFIRKPTPIAAAAAPEPVAEAALEEAPKPKRGRPKRKAEETAAEEA